MRVNLSKRTSTKAERIFAEILKRNHVSFLHRQRVEGREVDFLVGKYAIEIDGHPQSAERNAMLVRNGFVPLHYTNRIMRLDPEGVEEDFITKLHRTYVRPNVLLKASEDSR